MKKILITDPVAESGIAILKKASLEVIYMPEASDEELEPVIATVHGWIIRSGTKITAEKINKAVNLQAIGRAGVGVDNIDIPKATRKGIVVMNTPDVNTISAAEHTIGLILAVARNISTGHQGLNRGEWNRNALVGHELRNKILGVVGLGKIGREVIKRCRSFGMKILGYDPYISSDMFNPEEISLTDLDNLTKKSDFITLHVPLVDSTRDLFDLERLKMMKSSARIINVARGGIINENDLATALNEDMIAGAAVDVFTSEPIPADHPLVNLDNCVLTPHLGASTREAKEGVSVAVCEQIRDFINDNQLINALNIPISDMAKLHLLKPYLELAELMGKLHGQLANGVIKTVQIECAGTIDEVKPISLAFVKGLLEDRIPERLNFINAETLAKERGITIEAGFSSISSSFSNLIRTRIITDQGDNLIEGSVFEGGRLRIVNVLGYEMELTPKGIMLFVRNLDVPGVVGKVGSILGSAQVNIGAYLLSRKRETKEAFAVIRVDSPVPEKTLVKLEKLPEITELKQISC